MDFEISKNICEICSQKATAGILDETPANQNKVFMSGSLLTCL